MSHLSHCHSKREVHSNTSLLKRQEKHKINNLNFHLKQLGKGKNAKVSRRKEIIKIRSEISEKEMKETIEKNQQN